MTRSAEPMASVESLGEPASAAPRRAIRTLPPLLVNQIAAGEVIERPASVVKELIDNAIDAGATRIALEIEAGGIELIRVTDNGCGVPLEQAALMLAPHATSKIASAEDLDRIATMGFRGEALASIVSVARVRVRSRSREEASAWVIEAEGDRADGPRPAPGPVGTCVEARNLFFNTPARRKFLRTPQTEQQHCLDVVRDLACAHPGIGFVASCDGRSALDLAPAMGARDRALDVLGRDLESQLLEASADRFDDARGVLLWGIVGLPSIARATTRAQRVYINGRPVRDRTIQHALQEAYRGLMPHDRKPTAALLLEMAPEAVDVNVHPTKAEVRFRDSGLVHSVVLRAVREALRRADLTPEIEGAFGARPEARWGSGVLPGANGGGAGAAGANVFGAGVTGANLPSAGDPSFRARRGSDGSNSLTSTTLGAAAEAFVEFFRRAPTPNGPTRFDYDSVRRAVEASPDSGASASGNPSISPSPVAPSGDILSQGERGLQALTDAPTPSRGALQVHNSFVVTQDEEGIVIVDQHALHERVMFEAIMERLRIAASAPAPGQSTPGANTPGANTPGANAPGAHATGCGSLESQRLLTPSVASVAPNHVEILEQLRPTLARLGIEAAPIGPTSIAVHAFPTLLFERGVEAGEFIAETLERAERDGVPASEEGVIHEIVDMMACKAAVKAGDRMSGAELAALLDLRETVERASSCPHGRPTSIRLSVRELERRFGRG